MNGTKALGDWVVAIVTKQKLLYQLEIFLDLPNTFEGFRFVTFGILVILVVGPIRPPPIGAWCV